ncbi:zinc-binding dehydrogenase [Marinobacter salinisoli]|uniref:Zinc-binding dehydrogenase n=1 Tax=Marinobacter salinisoli TaxID=2769486 RepID=A0ABX7MPK1_9GAMM|nr:zinc-binding dehydrogenase [Marinobacter salinisoli]QSP94179.1 zinc-binding dehydrogenase [Marinobacter salinisoli]
MKALTLSGPGMLSMDHIEVPAARADRARITVHIAGFGGSEMLALGNPGVRPLPNIMGHSISGKTAQGERATVFPLLSCGQCQYCREALSQLCDQWRLIGVQEPGGFAQQVVVPQASLVPLPDALSWEQASFIEPFANSINAWQRAQPKPTDSVLVIGAGALGLGLVAAAVEQECAAISVCEISEHRQEAARVLGANATAAQIAGEFDVVFDTVGTPETRQMGMHCTRKNGKCVFMGFASASNDVPFNQFIREQKSLIGSFVFSRAQFEQAVTLAGQCRSDWVQNLSFDQVEAQLRAFARGEFHTVRAALRPNGW